MVALLIVCLPANAQTMAITLDGSPLTANQCLAPWTDGTQVCISRESSGFRLMTFDHPEHKRWVVQYANEGVRANDGGSKKLSKPYTAEILLNGASIASYAIARHAMGQEWSHEDGARPPIRTASDLEDRGDIPYHTRPIRYWLNGFEPKPKPRFRQVAPYNPLHIGPLTAWMPAQGRHHEVHWTTDLSYAAIYHDDPAIVSEATKRIKLSAESFGAYPLFLTQKGALHPIDLRTDYYENSAFLKSGWASNGNEVVFSMPSPPQPGEGGRGNFGDTAHLACPGWEQFLLDGDPYHLRALQFCSNWGIGRTGNSYRAQGSKDGKAALVPARDQGRSYGKVLMLLWRAYDYTPQGSWEWLLPKSYFEQALNDSAHQAGAFLAKFPNVTAGNIQIDYAGQNNPSTAVFQGIQGLSHSDVQALWSVGWMVRKGWAGFQPLYDVMSQGFIDAWDVLGPPTMTIQAEMLKAKMPDGKTKRVFQTWEEVADWARETQDKPVGKDAPLWKFVWQEQRFEGVFTSLSQMGFGDMTPLAQVMRDSRLLLSKCYVQKKHAPQADAGCPAWDYNLGPLIEDWSFDLKTSAEIKATRKAKASQLPNAGAFTQPKTSPSQAIAPEQMPTAISKKTRASTQERPSQTQRREPETSRKPDPDISADLAGVSPMPAQPGNTLPPAGETNLPDPGTINLPDPGLVSLP